MAVKSLRGGVDTLLGEANTEIEMTYQSERSGRTARKPGKAADNDDTRATFIVKKNRLEQLKAIAYWDRAKIKDVHDAALEMYIESRKDDIPKVLTNRAKKRG